MTIRTGPLSFEGETPPDPSQFRAAGEEDAARDRQWFLAHPGETTRIRPPSLWETMNLDLPFGTKVGVFQLSDGTQGKAYLNAPDTSQAN